MKPIVTWPYRLQSGKSFSGIDRVCALNVISWIIDGRSGYNPTGVSPLIRLYTILGNDALPDDRRQALLAYLHRIAGSQSRDDESERRRFLVLDVVRRLGPLALDVLGLSAEAARMEDLADDVLPNELKGIVNEVVNTTEDSVGHQRAWTQSSYLIADSVLRNMAPQELALFVLRCMKDMMMFMEDENDREMIRFALVMMNGANFLRRFVKFADDTWQDYFMILEHMLNIGPQGEPWTAEAVAVAVARFHAAGGVGEPLACSV